MSVKPTGSITTPNYYNPKSKVLSVYADDVAVGTTDKVDGVPLTTVTEVGTAELGDAESEAVELLPTDQPRTSIAPLETSPVAVLALAGTAKVALEPSARLLAAEEDAVVPTGEAASASAVACEGEIVVLASMVAGAALTASPKVSGTESMKARVGPAKMLAVN